ncbi:MAG TPA: GNAT family N-acetyltransferase, partial [Phototrophicaceae bacterium]|nr:GNAT family N-acetyltransferase [Phototrophicaceae bacterium]
EYVRPAIAADMPVLIALLQEAQVWMDGRSLHQWVPGAHDPSLVEAMIARQTLYVHERDGRIVATCQLRDVLPAHWTIPHEPVGYISTLTVERASAGQGIGANLLRWAEGELRGKGKAWACLDCFGKNLRLRAYYEARGYTALGEVETYPDYPERMYRKPLR